MQFYDLTTFLRLSEVLNYQLSAKPVDWTNIMTIILRGKTVSDYDRDVLLQVFDYMSQVYGQKRRRLGPLLVLHPLRSTAMLYRAFDNPTLLDLMTSLLHDNFEDIKAKDSGTSNWISFNNQFQSFLKDIPQSDQWFLMERLQWLTKESDESYYQYIGRLLDQSLDTPEVIRIKLADRLDNTLDLHIDLEDPLQKVDFFETIFQLMFIKSYRGYKPETSHPSYTAINGAQRLYQLFKNIVLMSLIRQKKAAVNDKVAQKIFNNLANASMKEAQRIILHISGYHVTEIPTLRELMIETMVYVQQGGTDLVTPPTAGSRLDGLFMSRFDNPVKQIHNKKLAELYQNKPLMIEAAISFVVIFLSFMNDPNYFVRGISEEGVRPAPK